MVKGKQQGKKGKGKGKKKVDSFVKKEWYRVRAPKWFERREVGWTVVNKTQGNRIAADSLKGRVFEVNLADLAEDFKKNVPNHQTFRKMKLLAEEVDGKMILTNFHGCDMTTDKIRSLIFKWQSLVEAWVDVKTTDGYVLRVFAIGFTKQQANQVKKTCYAKTSQVRQIRAKMVQTIKDMVEKSSLEGVVKNLNTRAKPDDALTMFGLALEKACTNIFPMANCHVRKIKVLKRPKFDIQQLMQLHEGGNEEVGYGEPMDRIDDEEEDLVIPDDETPQ